ncbi:hypothetical protein EDB81DRAFT_807720 [Dactylonectria macrodidyma]|uniref:Uncharacterized protein n=1 Tax=Dactylonectria macrodidyma TaxID=307937 RepID=A0A9P9E6N1_9HYPO|nr:hypothetical protein EDB81DRAFT_807720 [Dactylonectria macrodidyma]
MIRLPFEKNCQLEDSLDGLGNHPQDEDLRLPGHPRIFMTHADTIRSHLKQEHLLKDLERLSGYLWMMSKQDSRSISPLHRQGVKRRTIVLTEDPRLHLIWYHDHIFIKPLPKYLLSYNFWQAYLSADDATLDGGESLRKAILGYLRTYAHLVRYESDFRIAIREDLKLIPEGVSFKEFCDFIIAFEYLPDSEVAGRYAFGEIRLSRLNFYAMIFLRKQNFHRVHGQYSDYFGIYFAPLLFLFGTLSVLTSAMQLTMAVEVVDPIWKDNGFWDACRWVGTIVMGIVSVLASWLIALFLHKFTKEWVIAIRHQWF